MTNTLSLRLLSALAAGALLLSLTGCPGGGDLERPPDWKSGADKTRGGAKEVALNTVHVDNADFKGGDRTDWKYFQIPAPGVVTISINFDNSKAYGELMVTDERGQAISTYQDEKKDQLDRITFMAETGRYYIKVWVNDQDSDYSLRTDYSPR